MKKSVESILSDYERMGAKSILNKGGRHLLELNGDSIAIEEVNSRIVVKRKRIEQDEFGNPYYRLISYSTFGV